jgi:hypothetical protein
MTREQAILELQQADPELIEEAVSEIEREMHVRERCYDRWVNEGKMSRIDAKDRMNRQIMAYKLLAMLLDSIAGPVQ